MNYDDLFLEKKIVTLLDHHDGRWMRLMSFGIVVDLRRSCCSDKFIRFVQIEAGFTACLP